VSIVRHDTCPRGLSCATTEDEPDCGHEPTPLRERLFIVAVWLVMLIGFAALCMTDARAGDLPASCRLEGAPTPRPDWCRPGWSCRPTAEDNALGICLVDLKAAIASCSTSKYGWCAGGGFTFGATPVSVEADGKPADFQMRWQPSLGFSLTWGRRLP